jgi:hypothetical protein
MCLAEEQIFNIEETTQINLGNEINCISINEKLNRIYLGVSDTVVVIDGKSKQVLTTVQCNAASEIVEWIVVDSSNNQIWARINDDLLLINGETYSVVNRTEMPDIDERTEFAIDPQRKRCYMVSFAKIFGDSDEILVYDSTDCTEIGRIEIPGTSEEKHITRSLDIAVDAELGRVYAEWNQQRLFIFDGTSGTVIKETYYEGIIGEVTQFYDNKIYKIGPGAYIYDANTFDQIWWAVGIDFWPIIFNPRDSTVYGFQDTGLRDDNDFRLFSLQILDPLTNRTLASSTKLFTSNHLLMSVNSQTGEIYLVEESGLIIVMSMASSTYSPPQTPTDEGTIDEEPLTNEEPSSDKFVPIVVATVFIVVVICIVAFRMRRKRK